MKRLQEQPALFQTVQSLNENEFFQRNALLFASNEEVQAFATQFAQAQALFQVLNTDPSLRGLVQALTFGLAGLQRKMYTLDDMTPTHTSSRRHWKTPPPESRRASPGANW